MAVATTVLSCISEGRESSVTSLEAVGALTLVGRQSGAVDLMSEHKRLVRLYSGVEAEVVKTVCVLGGKMFVALAANGAMALWDLKSYELRHLLELGGVERAYDMVLAEDALYVACGNRSVVKVEVDTDAHQLVRGEVVYRDSRAALTCIATVDGAKRMVVGSADSRVVVLDASAKLSINTLELPKPPAARGGKRRRLGRNDTAPDDFFRGETVDRDVNVFKLAAQLEGKREAAAEAERENALYSENVVLSLATLNSRVAVASDSNGRVFIIDVATATIIQEHIGNNQSPVVHIYAHSPSAFLAASISGKVTHYCCSTGDRRLWVAVCDRQVKLSHCTAVLVDNEDRIVAGGADGYLQIYDSLEDFDSLKISGSCTPLSLNASCDVISSDSHSLVLEGKGTKALTVWSLLRAASESLSKVQKQIVAIARSKLSHPLCLRMDKLDASNTQHWWDVVKVAKVEFPKTVCHACVCSAKGHRFVLFVECADRSRYFFEIDMKDLRLKKRKFSSKPGIAASLKHAQIAGTWPLLADSQVVKMVIAHSRISRDKRDQTVVVSGLAHIDYDGDKFVSLSSAAEEPQTALQLSGNHILRDDRRATVLMSLQGDCLEKLASLQPARNCHLVLGRTLVLAVHYHLPVISIYNIRQRTWVLRDAKLNIAFELRCALLLSGGRETVSSEGCVEFVLYGARTLIKVKLSDDGSKLLDTVTEDAQLADHQHIQDVAVYGADDLVVFANELNAELYRPRVYGRY